MQKNYDGQFCVTWYHFIMVMVPSMIALIAAGYILIDSMENRLQKQIDQMQLVNNEISRSIGNMRIDIAAIRYNVLPSLIENAKEEKRRWLYKDKEVPIE